MEKQAMKTNMIVAAAVAVVVGGGAGFVGGMKYQQSKTTATFAQFAGAPGMMGNRGFGAGAGAGGQRARMGGGRPVIGDILSADDKSITVKLADGSTRIVILSTTTSINKAAQATKADLTVGQKVAAYGTDNSDGSMTAQSVQLNPIVMMRPNGSASPAPQASGAPTQQ